MYKVLSIPPNLVDSFNKITKLPCDEWFAISDPNGQKIGSGGGTSWAISSHYKKNNRKNSFSEKRIIIHAGGQSRRLPSYAPSGKILTPIPVFKWSRGQSIQQTLLSLQVPLYESIMEMSTPNQNTLIASGDVYTLINKLPNSIPNADVVCCGINCSFQVATNHGVFFTQKNNANALDFMLQKPSVDNIEKYSETHSILMDIGIWILSDKALDVLMKKCGWNGSEYINGIPSYYDLYSDFGMALGLNPQNIDSEISNLSVAIVPLDGEFYHFGTSKELISSIYKIQNHCASLYNQNITSSIFIQNSILNIEFTSNNENIWIENSTIGNFWQLSSNNIITGVPNNNWRIEVPEGICIDIVPIDDDKYVVRPYGINDKFRGDLSSDATKYMGMPFVSWLNRFKIDIDKSEFNSIDIQLAPLFPIVNNIDEIYEMLQIMVFAKGDVKKWVSKKRISAEEICRKANIERLFSQRNSNLNLNIAEVGNKYSCSYNQIDLREFSKFWKDNIAEKPSENLFEDSLLSKMRYQMFCSEIERLKGQSYNEERHKAFEIMRDIIKQTIKTKSNPRCDIYKDQIVCGHSPARLDLAGGWADTPPYCLLEGGCVVNVAVELNGQLPIQVYARISNNKNIVIHSIDSGESEIVSTYDDLINYNKVGSVFSIAKAALCLSGFHPLYCQRQYNSLKEQLECFGGGIEITQLVAIPKGSGLGTSSILSATILGVLSDFCGLLWDKNQICYRTFVLEQMLTTGGGWQDQYGGVFGGVKMLTSSSGMQDVISIKTLSEQIFGNKGRWLLYYTGITRVAKNILDEIVANIILNDAESITTINNIKNHAIEMADVIQRSDIDAVGLLLRRSWKLNCKLDKGTTTPEIEKIIDLIDEYSLGYKLLGAGGGGYMLICVKDESSATSIKNILKQKNINDKARFVDMKISSVGMQISRS